jgi:multidrug resistance efflux pump
MKLINRAFFVLLILNSLFLTGCSESAGNKGMEYHFVSEKRNKVAVLRATLKPGDITNISLTSGYGIIEWMAEEGTQVASGDVVLKIDMESLDLRVRNREKNIATQLDQLEKLKKVVPAEIAELNKNLNLKRLDYQRAEFEKKWLKIKKDQGEIWKLNADLEMALINHKLADQLYQLKKNITEKGFDSPFSLRTSEIERKSREIELDYAKRMLRQIEQPPLPEELAQVEFQKTVASGEIWLAENQLVSASISSQIRENNLEVVLERFRSSYREQKKSLDEMVQYAPRPGIVVHPVLWGDFKFRVGQNAWPGVGILQVINQGKYYLEARVKESYAGQLVEKASATIVLDSLPGRRFKGEVKSIGKSSKTIRGARNSSFKFIPVEITMPASESLLIGSKAEVFVDLGVKDGVFIPRDLLIEKDKRNFVLLKSTFGVKEIEVELEDFDKDWVLWRNSAVSEGVLLYP